VTGRALTTAPGALIEVATWRPVEVVDVDGWQAGFAGGFTSRANSVVPAAEPADLDEAIERVEALYRDRGLPARFRICAAARPDRLEEHLEERGYAAVATTLVLARELADLPAPPDMTGVSFDLSCDPDDRWLAGWLDVKAAGRAVDAGLARAVVSGSPASYVTARDTAGVVGVIRAAAAESWVGLSCLMVAPRARRRGLGRALTVAALEAAAAAGAQRAFLQVEVGNSPARSLYERMGFAPAETYHYRERATSGAQSR